MLPMCFKTFFSWLQYFPCAEDISQAMDTMISHFFNEYCLLVEFLFFLYILVFFLLYNIVLVLCIPYLNYSHINLIFEVLFEFI